MLLSCVCRLRWMRICLLVCLHKAIYPTRSLLMSYDPINMVGMLPTFRNDVLHYYDIHGTVKLTRGTERVEEYVHMAKSKPVPLMSNCQKCRLYSEVGCSPPRVTEDTKSPTGGSQPVRPSTWVWWG